MKSSRSEFPASVKIEAFKRDNGTCQLCLKKIVRVAHYDHWPVAAALGGSGTLENCRLLCRPCHERITRTVDLPVIAKCKRVAETRMGLRAPKRQGFRRPPANYDSWSRRIRDD